MHKTILSGIVHETPEDIAKILLENDAILDCWPGCPHRRSSAQKWFTNKSM